MSTIIFWLYDRVSLLIDPNMFRDSINYHNNMKETKKQDLNKEFAS